MKFKIVSTNLPKPLEIESEATTWGAFKKDLEKNGISTKNIVGGVRSTKHTLDVDGAVIPHSNSVETIFLYANDMKSGAPRKGETREQYNARRRKEAAQKKSGTENKQIVDVETIINDIRNVATEINEIPAKLNAIETAIKNLPATSDDSAKLKAEWEAFRSELKVIRGWK